MNINKKKPDPPSQIVCGGGWNTDKNETVESLIDVKIYGYKFFIFWNVITVIIIGLFSYYLWKVDVPLLPYFLSATGIVYLTIQIYFIKMIIKRFGKKTRIVKEVGQKEKLKHDIRNLY